MKFNCGPGATLPSTDENSTPILIFDRQGRGPGITVGWAAADHVRLAGLVPDAKAWDFLAIALAVTAADGAANRRSSPDGWTRELDLTISVSDPDCWGAASTRLASALNFLTTDRWVLDLRAGGLIPRAPKKPAPSCAEAVVLLSGGLDSLIGAIDLAENGPRLLGVSQTVRGDAKRQDRFAASIGGGIEHLALNHNASIARELKETSQRARSMLFLAFAVVAATSTERYISGGTVPLYVCENGFIAINPPLTNARVGSLSTRTAHPEFLGEMQAILDGAGIRVKVENPYLGKTKGEMLKECQNQPLLELLAADSTSCGRFQRHKYKHCGRCVPCQIRRGAFISWGHSDETEYVYDELGRQDADHAKFDDVMSVAMALLEVGQLGVDRWSGSAVASPHIADKAGLRSMLARGLGELGELHARYGLR